MNSRKAVRIFTVTMLVLVTGSLGRGFGSKAEAKSIERPAPPVSSISNSAETVIIEPGQGFDPRLAEHAFVVLRGADGRVPRAYLWDEPLACPDSHFD
jgi:hypothetical protein